MVIVKLATPITELRHASVYSLSRNKPERESTRMHHGVLKEILICA